MFVDIAVTLSSMLSVSHKVPQCMGLLSSHLASTRPAAAVSGVDARFTLIAVPTRRH